MHVRTQLLQQQLLLIANYIFCVSYRWRRLFTQKLWVEFKRNVEATKCDSKILFNHRPGYNCLSGNLWRGIEYEQRARRRIYHNNERDVRQKNLFPNREQDQHKHNQEIESKDSVYPPV